MKENLAHKELFQLIHNKLKLEEIGRTFDYNDQKRVDDLRRFLDSLNADAPASELKPKDEKIEIPF